MNKNNLILSLLYISLNFSINDNKLKKFHDNFIYKLSNYKVYVNKIYFCPFYKKGNIFKRKYFYFSSEKSP